MGVDRYLGGDIGRYNGSSVDDRLNGGVDGSVDGGVGESIDDTFGIEICDDASHIARDWVPGMSDIDMYHKFQEQVKESWQHYEGQ
eukprot:15362792-Ditylum_brightwellii.AAC.1